VTCNKNEKIWRSGLNHNPVVSVKRCSKVRTDDTGTAGHARAFASALTTKGKTMFLFFSYKLSQLKMDELTFFRVAHVWAFGTDPDLHDDLAQYLLHGILPKYVVNYLKTLQ
jgi:hypothetical protein